MRDHPEITSIEFLEPLSRLSLSHSCNMSVLLSAYRLSPLPLHPPVLASFMDGHQHMHVKHLKRSTRDIQIERHRALLVFSLSPFPREITPID